MAKTQKPKPVDEDAQYPSFEEEPLLDGESEDEWRARTIKNGPPPNPVTHDE